MAKTISTPNCVYTMGRVRWKSRGGRGAVVSDAEKAALRDLLSGGAAMEEPEARVASQVRSFRLHGRFEAAAVGMFYRSGRNVAVLCCNCGALPPAPAQGHDLSLRFAGRYAHAHRSCPLVSVSIACLTACLSPFLGLNASLFLTSCLPSSCVYLSYHMSASLLPRLSQPI